MSTSSRVRTRQPRRPSQAESNRLPRGETVLTIVRSILLAVAAVSVLGTSNYFAYLIGRKQATFEELHRQVERVVQSMDEKQVQAEFAPTTLKQQQDRLEQNAPGLIDLTTSTINGKTTAIAPEPAERPFAAPVDAAPAPPPGGEARQQPQEPSANAVPKHRDVRGVAKRRASRRHTLPEPAPADPLAQQPGQITAAPATPTAWARPRC